MEGIEIFQCPKAQNGCLKTQSFLEPNQSTKLSGTIENFIDQTACLKNENFYKPIWTMKWIDHHQNFNAQIDCLKNSIFSQTDPVLYCWIELKYFKVL